MPTRKITEARDTTAEEFLERLSARHPTWRSEPRHTEWIFRGHGDATWKLNPKGVRDTSEFGKHGVEFGPTDYQSSLEVLRRLPLVSRILSDFRDGLDRLGVVAPTPGPAVHSAERDSGTHTGGEPERDAWPLMALAQHHGLPTLLLDWSRRGWVAAYHAAADSTRFGRTSGDLCVWGMKRKLAVSDEHRAPRFYQAPGGSNPNLRAQNGLFTIFISENDPPVETYFESSDPTRSAILELTKNSLPNSEAGRLLRLLALEGITGESMFPSVDGVVLGMKERARWKE